VKRGAKQNGALKQLLGHSGYIGSSTRISDYFVKSIQTSIKTALRCLQVKYQNSMLRILDQVVILQAFLTILHPCKELNDNL
jgi:hypothetical protein